MTPEQLKAFENWVVEAYHNRKIKSPVHLSGSLNDIQEKALIEIFKEIKPNDWVFSTYRSHYHSLLKGVPEERLKKWILDNKSIHFMDKEHKVVSSAIVGGCLPIALGTAMAIKQKWIESVKGLYIAGGVSETRRERARREAIDAFGGHVWCFIGDMTASLGVFRDCYHYAEYNNLPITFVVEDNGLSTDTPTSDAWGFNVSNFLESSNENPTYNRYLKYYKYERIYQHYGVSKQGEKRLIVNFDDKKTGAVGT